MHMLMGDLHGDEYRKLLLLLGEQCKGEDSRGRVGVKACLGVAQEVRIC